LAARLADPTAAQPTKATTIGRQYQLITTHVYGSTFQIGGDFGELAEGGSIFFKSAD